MMILSKDKTLSKVNIVINVIFLNISTSYVMKNVVKIDNQLTYHSPSEAIGLSL